MKVEMIGLIIGSLTAAAVGIAWIELTPIKVKKTRKGKET